MITMGKESKLSSEEVIEKAVAFFGPGGEGMEVTGNSDCCASFTGGGGHVDVHVAELEDKDGSEVTIEGREWDYQIRQFIQTI